MFTDEQDAMWEEAYESALANLRSLSATERGQALIHDLSANEWNMDDVKQNALACALEEFIVHRMFPVAQ